MTSEITASFETLVEEGPMIVSMFLSEAVPRIDEQFGEGFAKKHPLLTGMFVLASTIESSAALLAQQIRSGLSTTASAIEWVSLHEVTHKLQSLTEATESVANAIENT